MSVEKRKAADAKWNMSWATQPQQKRKTKVERKRISINGKKDTFKAWSKKYKVPESILRARYAQGLMGRDLVKKVNTKGKIVSFMGRKGTVGELAKKFKVAYHMMWCAVYVASKVKN